MFEGDPGVFFGPLTGVDVGQMPADLLPQRLGWEVERFSPVGPYAELRLQSAESLREAGHGEDEETFGRELLMLESLMVGALEFDAPSAAAMGLIPWDKAAPDAEANGPAPEKKAKRMARRLFQEDDDEDDLPRRKAQAPDPDVLKRAANLAEAIVRVRALEATSTEGDRRSALINLRVDLQRRLTRERRHDAALDALLPAITEVNAATAATLRAGLDGPAASPMSPVALPSNVVRIGRSSSADNPYLTALAEAEARLSEPLARDAAPPDTRLEGVREAAAESVRKALVHGPGAAAGDRAARQARKRFAEEVALSGGRPGSTGAVDTLELRRALAERFPAPAAPSPPPDALVAAAGLPEVPVLSTRGPKARVLDAVPAGARVDVLGPPSDGFYPVSVSGRRGWVSEAFLRRSGDRPLPWPQPITPPDRLAPLPPAVRPQTRLRGTSGGPVDVRNVLVEGASAEGQGTRDVVSAALSALPDVLQSRMRGRPARRTEVPELSLVLDLPQGTRDPQIRGRILADQLADALMRMGAGTLDTLKLELRVREAPAGPTPERLLEQVGADDADGLARTLATERRTLDAATRSRLASFFGHDFGDVMVFAGPMSGAMARSLSAEAFTHGKMVFFDPKHFRTDTARGEALLAHELTHTRQTESDRDVKGKEAEALAAEARYLDWVSPGGAPLAKELSDEAGASSASAQAAGDAGPTRHRVQRAESGRQLEASEGPRADTAKFEERVKNVLTRVQEMMSDRGDFEADRIGRLIRAGVVRL